MACIDFLTLPPQHAQRRGKPVILSDFDVPHSRPITPAGLFADIAGYGQKSIGTEEESGEAPSWRNATRRIDGIPCEQIESVRDRLLKNKQYLTLMQQTCDIEMGKVDYYLEGLRSGYFTAEDLSKTSDIANVMQSFSIPLYRSSDSVQHEGFGCVNADLAENGPSAVERVSSETAKFSSCPSSVEVEPEAAQVDEVAGTEIPGVVSGLDDQVSPPLLSANISDECRKDELPRDVRQSIGLEGNAQAAFQQPAMRRRGSLYDKHAEAIAKTRERKASDEQIKGKARQKDVWFRNRDEVERLALKFCGWAAMLALLGSVAAILQNELVYKQYDPQGQEINMLKLVNLIFSVGCILCIYYNYHLHLLIFRVNRHCRRLTPIDSSSVLYDVMTRQPLFWAEVLVCGLHCPPGISTEFSTETFDNIIVYRAETLGALINTLRAYLLWKYFRDRKFLSMPKKHLIAGFTGAETNSVYAIKIMLRGATGLLTIAVMWFSSIIMIAYWYRAAEITACSLNTTLHPKCQLERAHTWSLYGSEFHHNNEVFLWDAIWLMFISTLTIGYGDIAPTTHYGRVCVTVIVAVGMLLATLLTGSLTYLLEWSEEEFTTLRLLEREKARVLMIKLAHQRLKVRVQDFVNRRRFRSHRQNVQTVSQRISLFNTQLLEFLRHPIRYMHDYRPAAQGQELTARLRLLQKQAAKDTNCLLSDTEKIDKVYSRVKKVASSVARLHQNIQHKDTLQRLAERMNLNLQEQSRRLEHGISSSPSLEIEFSESGFQQETSALDSISRDISFRSRHLETVSLHTSKRDVDSSIHRTNSFILKKQEKRQAALEGDLWNRDGKTYFWWKDKDAISLAHDRTRIWAAVFGVAGTISAIFQNEAIIYSYASNEQLNASKAINSVCTFLCLASIARGYWLRVLLDRVLEHLQKFRQIITAGVTKEVLTNRWFWLEMVIVGPHCLPFMEYSYGTSIMGNFQVYEIESVFACINMLRLLLVWRVVEDWMLSDLPNRYSMQGFLSFEMGSAFVLKRMLHGWKSIFYVIAAWIVSIVWFGYWFRCSELSACLFPEIKGRKRHDGCSAPNAVTWIHAGNAYIKVNDDEFENACWHMFITATTVGYGEVYVTTHFGRACAICAGFVGMILVATTTATFSNLLSWTPEEDTANAVINREEKRIRRRSIAVGMICRWWRKRMTESRLGGKQRAMVTAYRRVHGLAAKAYKRQFSSSIKDANRDSRDAEELKQLKRDLDNMQLDDLQGLSDKIDLLALRMREIEDDMDDMHSLCHP